MGVVVMTVLPVAVMVSVLTEANVIFMTQLLEFVGAG